MNNVFKQPFPIIDIDDKYRLREQQVSDTASFLAYYSDPAVSHFILADIPSTLSGAEYEIRYCRTLFYRQQGLYWAIAEKSTDAMIGAIGLYLTNPPEAEICYDLHKGYWQRGLMTRCMIKAMRFIFSHHINDQLIAITIKENHASVALLLKLGFHHHETRKQDRHFQGKLHDTEIYLITKASFLKQFPDDTITA